VQGLFRTLYSDRGAHFWFKPKSGGKADRERPTQVGRALEDLGVQMIPAYFTPGAGTLGTEPDEREPMLSRAILSAHSKIGLAIHP